MDGILMIESDNEVFMKTKKDLDDHLGMRVLGDNMHFYTFNALLFDDLKHNSCHYYAYYHVLIFFPFIISYCS